MFVCGSHPAALRDPMAMERANLLNMAKLSIKGLIESALSFGRTLDSDYPPLQQFFVVMEHCLKHGLRGKSERDVLNGVRCGRCACVAISQLSKIRCLSCTVVFF